MKIKLVTTICILCSVITASTATVFGLAANGVIKLTSDNVKVKFYNDANNDTLLWETEIPSGTEVKYEGPLPKKESDDEYSYTFSSWDKTLNNVAADTSFYALYLKKPREYEVTFKNYNRAVLYRDYVSYNGTAVYCGAAPTRPSDENYTYTFSGWDKSLEGIKEDTVINATYELADADFTVTYKNYDEEVLFIDHVKKGESSSYSGMKPYRPSDTEYSYTFIGWDKDLSAIYTDTITHAAYEKEEIKYKVEFYNYDSSLLFTDYVPAHGDATYGGITPIRPSDNVYQYTFKGWNKPIVDITEDIKVVAEFEKEYRKFSVTFYNYDDEVLYHTSVEYGQYAIYYGENPTREMDEKYIYHFAGWDREITNVVEDLKVYPLWDKELRTFAVSFKDEDGALLYTDYVEYGGTAVYQGETPYKDGGEFTAYEFVGWDKDLTNITADMDAIALFKPYTKGGGGDFEQKLTVQFYNYDGTLLDGHILELGETPDPSLDYYGPISQTPPNRDSSYINGNYYSFTFAGWSEPYIIGEVVYVYFAQYTARSSSYYWDQYYIVTYRGKDLELLYEDVVLSGSDSRYEGEMEEYLLPENGFLGWSCSQTNITASVTAYPLFETSI